MVEFYAPWCGHCHALAPEYAAAATELKGDDVVLAKVDTSQENELSHEYDDQGFPTVYFFIDGVHKPYNGHRTKYILSNSSNPSTQLNASRKKTPFYFFCSSTGGTY